MVLRAGSKGKATAASSAALCLALAACGGGGGGGGLGVGGGGGGGGGNGLTPFATASTDELPAGTRIDVSSKNLFQMGAGDIWYYTILDAKGNPTGSNATRQVTANDGAGHVTLLDNDGGSDTTNYTVSADGLLDTLPLGSTPAGMASIVGGIFEYATPLYPVGAVRRHVRSGPWGEDFDGDGIGESFRAEFTQAFLGFETAKLSDFVTLTDVAHFHNVLVLTLRPTHAGTRDYTTTLTEDTWFAPGLGLVKAQRTAVDSDGGTLDPPHTLLFRQGTVAGVNRDVTVPPPPPLDGSFVDVALVHNALVYDSSRNVYYASIPGSVIGNGNSIATIDPVTGQVSYSAPVGSEPGVLAIAADASALYVSLGGSGDVVKLIPPLMTEQGRAHLAARAMAVSPADPGVVAVSIGAGFGVGLLRDMVLQPKVASIAAYYGNNLITFDAAGAWLYGLNTETSEFGLRRIRVLADGLTEDGVVVASTRFDTKALSFSGDRVIGGGALYDAPALNALGVISGATDCVPRRADALLMCIANPDFSTGQARILLADPGTFVIRSSLLFALSEPFSFARGMVEGPAGQVAIDYAPSTIRLFSSPKLLTPPVPPAAVWPVTASSTADGQGLDVAIVHNALVYDSARNVYYASVPGSVIGSGNSIATIDPATGGVTHSAPIGSEPNALAIAADGSVLYAGLDGSGEVTRLALPSMAEQGRARLPVSTFSHGFAIAIAVSPADATVAGVALNGGATALLRNMVLQPNRIQVFTDNRALAFDTAGTSLYGADLNSGELHRIQVLADGLAGQGSATTNLGFGTFTISFSNNRVIAGRALFDAPALTPAGVISGASSCVPQRAGALLLCLATADFSTGQVRILVANSGTFVIGASLLAATLQPGSSVYPAIQGPAGQVAFAYSASPFTPRVVRLFSSVQLP